MQLCACGIWLSVKRGLQQVIVHEPCLVLPYPVQVIHICILSNDGLNNGQHDVAETADRFSRGLFYCRLIPHELVDRAGAVLKASKRKAG